MLDLRRLKAERIAKGYTQQEMADKMGYPDRAMYAKRENGYVNIGADDLFKISEILGIDNMRIFFNFNVPEREREEIK